MFFWVFANKKRRAYTWLPPRQTTQTLRRRLLTQADYWEGAHMTIVHLQPRKNTQPKALAKRTYPPLWTWHAAGDKDSMGSAYRYYSRHCLHLQKLLVNGCQPTANLSRTGGILTCGNLAVSSWNPWSSSSPKLSLCSRRECPLTGLCSHLDHPPAVRRRHPRSTLASFFQFVCPARGRQLLVPLLDLPFPARSSSACA